VHIAPRGRRASPSESGVYEDLDGRLVPGAAPYGSFLIVRPDRTILHDGPAEDVDLIVRESLNVLGAASSED
jgi:3-(3-hydroxy-phenyl)propionate hydroxylase